MIRRFVLILTVFFSALHCCAQKKEYPSLLWEITSESGDKPSYLYGTMHVSSRIAFSLSDSFFVALNNADVIALESDPSEWMDEMEKADMFSANYDYKGSPLSSGDFYSKAFNIDIPNQKDLAEVLRFEPSIVNGLLYRFSGYEADFEEDTYLDLFIFQAGKKMKKEVVNLEDFQEVQKLSEKAARESMNSPEKPNPFGYDTNPYELIQDAYRDGDLNTLDSIMMILNNEAYTQYMLFQRNDQMAAKMDSIINSGNSLFTGIGAAHLAGEKGVIELLRSKGYNVRPILKAFTDKSIKRRKKIDQISISLDHSPQFPTDSSFSVNMPGRLYELPMSGGKQTYIHPEMIHGSNYSIVRLKTFNSITGLSSDDIIQSVDSLLFENIPGEIVKKKLSQIDGHPAFDILNKTRRGDYQRYKIVALPSELIVFKIKGTRKFAKSKEADKFFESISFNKPDKSNWQPFKSPGKEFTIKLPYAVSENSASSMDGLISLQVDDPLTGDLYLIQRNILHDYKYIEEDSFELTYLIESIATESGFSVDTCFSFNHPSGYPAAKGELKAANGTPIYIETILKGGKYYMLTQMSASGVLEKQFFSSFNLPVEEYEPFKEYVDSTLFFKVNTVEVPSDFGSEIYNDFYYDEENTDEDLSYLPVSDSRVFFNETTGEKIVVDYYKYHKYRSEKDEQSFWQKRLNTTWNYDNLVRSKVSEGDINGYPYREFYYTDTASVRKINNRIILKNSTKYSIYYLNDTLSRNSSFASTFLDSFEPLDTVYTTSFFTNKSEQFFKDLWSSDSTLAEQALNSITEVYLSDSSTPEIIKTIDTFKAENFGNAEKAFLIEELGYLAHEEILPYLKRKYYQVEDTALFQIAILKALGSQKSKPAADLFKELILYEVPLSKISEINPIFFEFKDSLDLAQYLFPEILELSALDEYQETIYQLAARLKDEGLLKPSDYKEKLKEIKWEARNTLKRVLASQEGEEDNEYGNYLSDDYLFGAFYYKPNEYNRKFYNDKLSVFNSLLNPYADDPRVKTYFEKQKKLSDIDQIVAIKSMDIVLKKPLEEKYKIQLCNANKARKSLYELSKRFELNLDKDCLTQEKLAESILFKNAQPKDSVSLVTTKKVTVKGREGVVYFFKSLNSYNDQWQVSYYGLFSEKEDDLEVLETLRGNKIKLRTATVEKKIQEIVNDFKLHGRQRADKKSTGGFNDYYLYD